jgi:hypothetical protein
MRKFPALGSALVLALTGAFVAAPALAHTHHPSTPQERQQTRDLNLQQLQIAQGQAPANQQAMNAQGDAQAQAQGQMQPQQPAASDQAGNAQTAPTTAPRGPAPADNVSQPASQTPSNAPQMHQQAPSGY